MLGSVRKHLLFPRKCFQMEMTAIIAMISIFYMFSILYFQEENTPLQGKGVKVWSPFWIAAHIHTSICRGGGPTEALTCLAIVHSTLEMTLVKSQQHSQEGRSDGEGLRRKRRWRQGWGGGEGDRQSDEFSSLTSQSYSQEKISRHQVRVI